MLRYCSLVVVFLIISLSYGQSNPYKLESSINVIILKSQVMDAWIDKDYYLCQKLIIKLETQYPSMEYDIQYAKRWVSSVTEKQKAVEEKILRGEDIALFRLDHVYDNMFNVHKYTTPNIGHPISKSRISLTMKSFVDTTAMTFVSSYYEQFPVEIAKIYLKCDSVLIEVPFGNQINIGGNILIETPANGELLKFLNQCPPEENLQIRYWGKFSSSDRLVTRRERRGIQYMLDGYKELISTK